MSDCMMPEFEFKACCCTCKHRLRDYGHPHTNGTSIMEPRGYICAAPEFDAVFSGWTEHGLCEMWERRFPLVAEPIRRPLLHRRSGIEVAVTGERL